MSKKDFRNRLSVVDDGFTVSQTQEEREAKQQIHENTTTEAKKKQRRVSLFMDNEAFNDLDIYSRFHGVSKNALVTELIRNFLTNERMAPAREAARILNTRS